ncbi:methionyl-tRNA formyltransferase [Bradyrhizobium sp. i1.3.6]
MSLRLIFMGTPDFSVPTLLELVSHGHEIAAVYTRAPKPGGRRGLQLQPTPVEEAARKLGVPVADAEVVEAARSARRVSCL